MRSKFPINNPHDLKSKKIHKNLSSFLLSYVTNFALMQILMALKCIKTLFQVGLCFQERFQSLLEKYPSGSSATHIEVRTFDLAVA